MTAIISLALAMALSGNPPLAAKKTQLKIEVKPAAAVFFVDGKRKGSGARTEVLAVAPGRHSIKVVHNKDMHEEVVSVKKGETTSWSWAFEDDRPKSQQPVEPHAEPVEPPAEPKTEPPH